MDARTTEMGWRELLADMDENTGTLEERIGVIRRRGEYAQDLARLRQRHDAEHATQEDTGDE